MKRLWTRLAGAAVVALCLLTPAVGQTPAERAARAWADLAIADEAAATRAALTLAAHPKEALPLLRQSLRPVKVEPKRVAALIKQLDSDGFADREAAYKELEYLGKFVKATLEQQRDVSDSAEVKRRLTRLLERIQAEDPPRPVAPKLRGGVSISTINGEMTISIGGQKLDLTPRIIEKRGPQLAWVRAVRAVAVLEHIGTAEARQLIEAMAAGETDALPTRAATEALTRMKKK